MRITGHGRREWYRNGENHVSSHRARSVRKMVLGYDVLILYN